MVKGSINQLQKGVCFNWGMRLIHDIYGTWICNGLFTLLDTDSSTNWIRIPNPMAVLYYVEHVHLAQIQIRIPNPWLRSPIAVVPILGWISGTKIGIIVRVRQFTEIKEYCMRLKKDKWKLNYRIISAFQLVSVTWMAHCIRCVTTKPDNVIVNQASERVCAPNV